MKKLILTLLLVAIAFPAFAADKEKESVYERVMRTGTIRCGWAVWPPYMDIDVNTGTLSGLMYDYVEALGKNLNLKIEWAEEIGWGDYIAALESGRIDMYCPGSSWNAQRARRADFVRPVFFMRSDIFVADDDMRFDRNLKALNDSGVTLTIIEGDIYDKITNRDFPKAKKLDLPQLATAADLFLTIANGKADAAITEVTMGVNFMKQNPGKIRMVKLDNPFGYLPVSLSVAGGQYRFRRMMDIASYEMLVNGSFSRLLDRYDPDHTLLLNVAKPYEVAK